MTHSPTHESRYSSHPTSSRPRCDNSALRCHSSWADLGLIAPPTMKSSSATYYCHISAAHGADIRATFQALLRNTMGNSLRYALWASLVSSLSPVLPAPPALQLAQAIAQRLGWSRSFLSQRCPLPMLNKSRPLASPTSIDSTEFAARPCQKLISPLFLSSTHPFLYLSLVSISSTHNHRVGIDPMISSWPFYRLCNSQELCRVNTCTKSNDSALLPS